MTANSVKRSNEKEEVISGYQSMIPSPPSTVGGYPALQSSAHHRNDPTETSDDVPIDVAEAGAIRPPRNAFQRFIREYRVLEFGSAVVLYLLAVVFAKVEVHARPIPMPMWLLLALGICLPVGTNLIVNYALPRVSQVRVIAHDTRDFLLSLFQSMALATFLTQFTKNITGRFRPSFYHMCKWNYDAVWDGVTNLCTDAAGEKEGRKSFPSGHASFAWATMLVLTVYLLGRSRLNCENRSNSTLRGGKKSLMLFMCCAPILLAAWISISRCIDNWHHYSDILAGSIVGAMSALFSFNYNYGSIFSWDSAGLPLEEIHERRMNQMKKDRELRDQQPRWHSRAPPLLKHMSSEYIVDLSHRSMDSYE
ncbi:hypothetical protein PRNP1_009466 [Phytophthora ramorum]